MSFKQKKMLGNFIAIAFVLVIIMIIAFLSTITYEPPEMPIRIGSSNTFSWGNVFKISSINGYRYEVVRIREGEIEKNEFYYDVDRIDGNYEIKIFPYDGIIKREIDARIVFDNLLYNCVSKQYEGKKETCEYFFQDSEVRKGLFATPMNLRKNAQFEVVEITSSIYREKVYESIKLEKQNNELTIWIVEEIPLPVRIEENKDGIITIANLKNYN